MTDELSINKTKSAVIQATPPEGDVPSGGNGEIKMASRS